MSETKMRPAESAKRPLTSLNPNMKLKRNIADILIVILRWAGSVDWKYSVITWGYGKQSDTAWN